MEPKWQLVHPWPPTLGGLALPLGPSLGEVSLLFSVLSGECREGGGEGRDDELFLFLCFFDDDEEGEV